MEKFRKYNEYVQDKNTDSSVEEAIEAFDFLGEGILMDLRKQGLWKGLKFLGTKALSKSIKFVKDNPQIKDALKDAVKKGGKGVMDDISTIMGEYEKKIADLEAKLAKENK